MSDQDNGAISSGGNGEDIPARVDEAREVFGRYGAEIRAMIDFHVKDRSSADDVFQDLFVSVVKNPIPPEIKDVRAYLFRAITNDVVDRFRQKRNRLEKIQIYGECRKHYAVQKDPQNIAIQAEETARILRLIDTRLPRREARAVIQRYELGLGASDTTTRLRVDKRSVSRYLTEAIRKMRILVSQDGGDAK
ncbi:MAG: RNA polymerase sigma factor [Planctomycetota bacterium]|nr:RNA polymerase sigma factor [Planctomycetota bacterium]